MLITLCKQTFPGLLRHQYEWSPYWQPQRYFRSGCCAPINHAVVRWLYFTEFGTNSVLLFETYVHHDYCAQCLDCLLICEVMLCSIAMQWIFARNNDKISIVIKIVLKCCSFCYTCCVVACCIVVLSASKFLLFFCDRVFHSLWSCDFIYIPFHCSVS